MRLFGYGSGLRNGRAHALKSPERDLVGSPTGTESAQNRSCHNRLRLTYESFLLVMSATQYNLLERNCTAVQPAFLILYVETDPSERMTGVRCIGLPVATMGPRLRDS